MSISQSVHLEMSHKVEGEFHFRTFPLERYALWPIASHTRACWLRPGDQPPLLVDYGTGKPVPEEQRGAPLPYFIEQFRDTCLGAHLRGIFSFGDAGVNRNRAVLLPDELVSVPSSLPDFAEPRSWLVDYKTGLVRAERLRVEGTVQDGQCKPTLVRRESSRNGIENLLPVMKWAMTGLPVIAAGKPDPEAVYRLDDDLRHPFLTPYKNGLYIMEKALLDAREQGWSPSAPLEVDLALYGDAPTTIEVLRTAGYHLVFDTPQQPGDFQITTATRILCRPLESGYGVSIFGLCKDGSLGSFICKAPPTERGYIGPSVRDQIRMVSSYFSDAGIPPWAFPVRGQPNGRLSAAICLYEPR